MEKKEVKKKVVKKDGALPLIKRVRGEGYTTDNRSLSRRFKNVKLQLWASDPRSWALHLRRA